ncbi:MAG: phytoene desaturase [Chitinophagaceae bacterium]|nr:phytoene desaturase [Anaerolineae bacterium]
MNTSPIVVIGAGIGGLSAAIRLAAAGKQVLILEKNGRVGGKMGEFEADGFRWDTGPSVITMCHVFEDLFASVGRKLEDYVDLHSVEPLTRYFYPDGVILDASSSISTMLSQIEKLEPRDVKGYLNYLAYAERIHRVTGSVFIYDHPPTLASFARVPIQDWLKADPFRTMDGAIRHFVRSPHLRQLLGRFATYVGGSPYQAPATLNVIAHVELTGGVWYPKGGVYTIAKGMAQLAQEIGVQICLDTTVEQIDVKEGIVCGVLITNGDYIATKTVIANADVTTIYKHLLAPSPTITKRLKRLTHHEPSCSGFILMLGVEGRYPQLAHHNIFFSNDYRAEFENIFQKHTPAENPTIYVAITSKTDSDHAPLGCENWFILVNAPPLSMEYDWSIHAHDYRDRILTKLADAGFDVRDKIRTEKMLTPLDLQNMSGAWRGALYGPSPNSKWTAFRRPHNRSSDVRGLYFAGGTTHPGGGVPMVTLSGKVAADFILEDEQSRI